MQGAGRRDQRVAVRPSRSGGSASPAARLLGRAAPHKIGSDWSNAGRYGGMAPGQARGTAARWRSLLPPDRPPPLFRWARYLLLTGVVVFAASTVLVPTGSSARPYLDGGLYDSLTVLGAIVIAGRAWCVATERLAWALLAVAIAANAVGDVVSTLFVGNNAQFPSIADPAYLTFYPCAYIALVLLFRARAP